MSTCCRTYLCCGFSGFHLIIAEKELIRLIWTVSSAITQMLWEHNVFSVSAFETIWANFEVEWQHSQLSVVKQSFLWVVMKHHSTCHIWLRILKPCHCGLSVDEFNDLCLTKIYIFTCLKRQWQQLLFSCCPCKDVSKVSKNNFSHQELQSTETTLHSIFFCTGVQWPVCNLFFLFSNQGELFDW